MPELIYRPEFGTPFISDHDRILRSLSSGQLKGDRQIYIDKKFVDARHGKTKLILRYDLLSQSEIAERKKQSFDMALPFYSDTDKLDRSLKPVVIGFGPAGIFAALILARYGLEPIVIERGSEMSSRVSQIDSFRQGMAGLDPECNISYGEGGAGTFSDGKLFTGITSGLKGFVSETFISHGADPDILYDSHPHIGTDVLRDVIVGIREEIRSLGGTVLFNARFDRFITSGNSITGLEFTAKGSRHVMECNRVILAIGNAGRDTFRYLHQDNVSMSSKSFAVGVRIEHRRSDIDTAQYGVDTLKTSNMSAANYKMSVDTSTGRKLYTFCMCPGGEVINASSGNGQAVVNGMSYRSRDLDNSNSALLIPVDEKDFGEDVLGGLIYQELLEKKAFAAAGSCGSVPVIRYEDLLRGRVSDHIGRIKPSVRPGYSFADFSEIFDRDQIDTLIDGISRMGRKIRGYDDPDSILSAVESRSSSPVRILRDMDSRQSLSLTGLYPAGEGAGYAGGIMSSAIDGINCANCLAKSLVK